MAMISPRTRSLLASMRVPNLPGVACHVFTGAMVVWWLEPTGASSAVNFGIPWSGILWAAMAAGVLLCVAGNLLNDWHDIEWDRRHRPERALPSGVFTRRKYLTFGILCLISAVVMMFASSASAGVVALAIAACVTIYTLCHKRTAWSVVPLAMCRGLLPWMGAQAVLPAGWEGREYLWMTAAAGSGLFLWVCGLSLDARRESTGGTRWDPLPVFLILLATLPPLAIAHWRYGIPTGFEIAPALVWLGMVFGPLRHTARQRVAGLLAGLPLLDFTIVAMFCNTSPATTPWALLGVPLLAFAGGRALQRLAAAT